MVDGHVMLEVWFLFDKSYHDHYGIPRYHHGNCHPPLNILLFWSRNGGFELEENNG